MATGFHAIAASATMHALSSSVIYIKAWLGRLLKLTSIRYLMAQHDHLGCGVSQVMSLRPRFQMAAQQAQSEGASEDDIEAIKGMARLFAELGESYVGLLAQGVC